MTIRHHYHILYHRVRETQLGHNKILPMRSSIGTYVSSKSGRSTLATIKLYLPRQMTTSFM